MSAFMDVNGLEKNASQYLYDSHKDCLKNLNICLISCSTGHAGTAPHLLNKNKELAAKANGVTKSQC
jgi:hypothetical protein